MTNSFADGMFARLGMVAAAVLALAMAHPVFFEDAVPVQNEGSFFRPGRVCQSCHNGLVAPSGENVSIGTDWRASMMANSARDPYWQAAVRREVMDHPNAQAHIEDECAACHMPMARIEARAQGRLGEVFAHLPVGRQTEPADMLAADGVSCTTCHQILDEQLGTRQSFNAGFAIDMVTPMGERAVFGPYDVDTGRSTVMHSASGFRQVQATHVQSSELCASCHTLYTTALGPEGEVVGELPEQVPYLEWQHSAYEGVQSCQSCHMPVVSDSTAITSVLGKPRADVSRHVFRGGNFFMLRMLNRYRAELGVEALPLELEAAAERTERHMQSASARLAIEETHLREQRLEISLRLENLAGHKLPTAYPSRRVWIHLEVLDSDGHVAFESGGLDAGGAIKGNDNDTDPSKYEPHYERIASEDQVQIYESVMQDTEGRVTTGLLTATGYAKDNRLLPAGFDKATAHEDVAVHGIAASDADFDSGFDTIAYEVDLKGIGGPYKVRASLWYQPIGFRWADNLRSYDAAETNRFVGYFDAMSDGSAIRLTSQEIAVAPP